MALIDTKPADLRAALAAAQSGDEIRLPAGQYKLPSLTAVQKDVVISGEPGATVVGGWVLTGCVGLTLRDLAIVSPLKGYGLQVKSSQRIRVERCAITGEAPEGSQPQGRGVQWTYCQEAAVVDCTFRRLRYGLMGSAVDKGEFSRNDLRDIWGDAMRGWSDSSDLLFEHNYATDLFIPTDVATHPDAFQFWTTNATKPTVGLTLRGNVYERGRGDPLQGLFLNDESGVGYRNVLIEGNAVVGPTWDGISVTGGRDIIVRDNLVQPVAFDPVRHASFIAEKVNPRIMIKRSAGIVTGNLARLSIAKGQTGLTVEAGPEPALAEAGDLSTLRAWQARNADPRDARIAELEAALSAALARGSDLAQQVELLSAWRSAVLAAVAA